jgi:hypothetical protein
VKERFKIEMLVRCKPKTWVNMKLLGIKEGVLGKVLNNPTNFGVRVLFENGIDTYCWGR